jgi:hypothetical protein
MEKAATSYVHYCPEPMRNHGIKYVEEILTPSP